MANFKMDKFLEKMIKEEEIRQEETVELIASENFVSDAVKQCVGSVFINKYAEGYPEQESIDVFVEKFPDYVHTGRVGRYYGGCRNVDMVELYCRYQWQKVFKTDYHVNVQPHCGSSANMIAYSAFLNPGDTILSSSMEAGGHLTHSSPVSFVSKLYKVETYGLNHEGYYDYEEIRRIANKVKPKLILCGASAYPRLIDFDAFRKICDEVGAYMMVDMAHIAGLIAAEEHPTPFGIADVITTTTHKTLRGSRGGMIFCKEEYAIKVDNANFPRTQGGPLMNEICGKAQAACECLTEEYKDYIRKVVHTSKKMALMLMDHGMDVVTDGTDNHLLILDLSRTHPHVTGKMLQDRLDGFNVTVNKEMVPGDKRNPVETSGVRIGTAPFVTKYDNDGDLLEETVSQIVRAAWELELLNSDILEKADLSRTTDYGDVEFAVLDHLFGKNENTNYLYCLADVPFEDGDICAVDFELIISDDCVKKSFSMEHFIKYDGVEEESDAY